jgi:hypothetical protein
MNFPKPELQNTRVIRLATRFLSLPATLLHAAYAKVVAFIRWLKPAEQRRLEDQARQSQVRRVLRGLPPVHVQK